MSFALEIASRVRLEQIQNALADFFRALDEQMAAEDASVPSPELQGSVAAIIQSSAEQRENLALALIALKAQAKFLRERVKDAEALARFKENEVRISEDAIQEAMRSAGAKRVSNVTTDFAIYRSPNMLVIFDEASIPAEYWREETNVTRTLDKDKILAAIGGGTEVPGAMLDENRTRLSIKGGLP